MSGLTDVWSGRAKAYRVSEHREGADLDRLVEWCEPGEGVRALDVASGGGHVARRLREAGCTVTTLDPAPGMGADVVARAEAIPFADAAFHVVACRIAPHHFADVAAATAEMARVSRNRVVVEDTLYVSERVEEAERLRDPTHVRSYTENEWLELFTSAGLRVEAREVFARRHPLGPWLERAGCTGDEAEQVRALLEDSIEGDDYVDRKLVLKGRKER